MLIKVAVQGMRTRSLNYIQVNLLQKTITLLETSFYQAIETDQPLESLKESLAALESSNTYPFFCWFTIERYLEDVLSQRRTIPNVAYRIAHQISEVPTVRRY
jgi:hypothetical protein